MGVSNQRTLPGIERRVGRHPEEHEDSTERWLGTDLNEIGDRVGRHIITGTYDWSDRGPVSPMRLHRFVFVSYLSRITFIPYFDFFGLPRMC